MTIGGTKSKIFQLVAFWHHTSSPAKNTRNAT